MSESSGCDSSLLIVRSSPKNACVSEKFRSDYPGKSQSCCFYIAPISGTITADTTLSVNQGLSPNQAEISRSTCGVQAQQWKLSLVLPFVVLVMVEKKVDNEPPILL